MSQLTNLDRGDRVKVFFNRHRPWIFITVAVIAVLLVVGYNWLMPKPSTTRTTSTAVKAAGTVPATAPSTASAVPVTPPVAVAASAPASAVVSSQPAKAPKPAPIVKAARESRESAARIANAALAEKERADRLEKENAALKADAIASATTSTPAVVPLAKPVEVKPQSKLFRWTKVGGDPCNPNAGCTLEWALGKTEWPQDVQLALLAAVKGSSSETINITSGLGGSKGPTWTGWMTWGKYQPKFEMHTIAAWPSGQYEPASLWTHTSGGTKYNLIKVRKCGNWGGWMEHIPPAVALVPPTKVDRPPVAAAKSPDVMPLGAIPIVACVEE